MAPKTPQVSLADLTKAKAAAARTGTPQPVRAADGSVAYYVDYDGSIIPSVIASDRRGSAQHASNTDRQASNALASGDQSQIVLSAKAREEQRQQLGQTQAAAGSAALRNLAAQQVGGPVWVNGQMQIVTGFHSDGTPIFGYQGSKTGKTPDTVINPLTGQPLAQGVQSAFDALNIGANYGALAGIQGTDRFVMAQGPTDVTTGMPANQSGYTPAGVGMTPAAAEHSYSANVASNGTSQMTIAQGVQWLVNLANQSPDAYNKLVVELKHAGYSGANGEMLTGGGYSESVGLAFARAAKDLSVQQQATGSTLGMDQYLQNRMTANRQAAEQATPRAQRNYTDPGTLMATAKSAAQEALGRNLTPDELARFEQSYRGQEDTYYNQMDSYNQAKAGAAAIGDNTGTGGFTTVQPDASGQANALVQGSQFGQDRANYSAQTYYQTIAQMFGIK